MRFAVFGACSIMLEKTYEQAHAEFVIIIFLFLRTSVFWHVGSFSGSRCSISFASLGFQCSPHIVGGL
jgi:hypothetical protein